MGQDQTTDRAHLRQVLLARRAALPQTARDAAALAVRRHVLAHFRFHPDQSLAAYWPIRDELDCAPLVETLIDRGHRVSLPVVEGPARPLVFRLHQRGGALAPAGFGAFAPPPCAPVVLPDIVLAPLLGFDAKGTRLGYGGGYYDRTIAGLPNRPFVLGLAFAEQEFDEIPRAGHDVPLDAVATQAGVRVFGSGRLA